MSRARLRTDADDVYSTLMWSPVGAGDDASWISGQSFGVDGGLLIPAQPFSVATPPLAQQPPARQLAGEPYRGSQYLRPPRSTVEPHAHPCRHVIAEDPPHTWRSSPL